jgi:EAL domain-containing protein (putative c-di-GMP-specific phosphodiesterase class I)
VYALKIDRMFVVNMMRRTEHLSVVKATVHLAHSLGIRVVAEGVELPEQAEVLRAMGCDEIQGYLLCRPLPAAEFMEWKAAGSARAFGPDGTAPASGA